MLEVLADGGSINFAFALNIRREPMAIIGVQSLDTGSDCFGEGQRWVQGLFIFIFYLFFFNDFIKLMMTG